MFSRAQNKMVLRPVRAPKERPYVGAMMSEMLLRREAVSVASRRELSSTDPRRVHPYVHPTPRPTPEEVAGLREGYAARRRGT